MACYNGEVKVVEALMSKSIPADPLDKYGDAPLLIASRKGSHDIVSVLIKAKCDINIRARTGETALHWCCSFLFPSVAPVRL